MYDYSAQIEAFRNQKVRLPTAFKEKLFAHRKTNRDRLIKRLPDRIPGLSIGTSSFRPQGSSAIDIIIQTKFVYEEYDIDDGLVLWKHQLVDEDDNPLSAAEVKEHVRQALKDKRFVKQPSIFTNAVRVFYKETDEERHHVDFPVYRKFINDGGETVRELASEDTWIESEPTQVTCWFLGEVEQRNSFESGKGTQLRQLTQLIKRFCRSRNNWDMPNGMKLMMLVAECQPSFNSRIDVAFRELLMAIDNRLQLTKIIRNLAHPDKPAITRTSADANVENLHEKTREALERLAGLDEDDADDIRSARRVWDWIFQSEGFFKEFDDEEQKAKKEAALQGARTLLASGGAYTSAVGVIGSTGILNQTHKFYGETH